MLLQVTLDKLLPSVASVETTQGDDWSPRATPLEGASRQHEHIHRFAVCDPPAKDQRSDEGDDVECKLHVGVLMETSSGKGGKGGSRDQLRCD